MMAEDVSVGYKTREGAIEGIRKQIDELEDVHLPSLSADTLVYRTQNILREMLELIEDGGNTPNQTQDASDTELLPPFGIPGDPTQ